MLQDQFVDLVMLEILERDPDLQFAAGLMNPHIQHDLRSTMDLASVLATLGIVDENQVSTAGTISIMKSASQYCNLDGVRIISVSTYLPETISLIAYYLYKINW